MLNFDNAGFTNNGPEAKITRSKPPPHRVAGLKLADDDRDEAEIETRKKDDFIPLLPQSGHFIRKNLDPYQF